MRVLQINVAVNSGSTGRIAEEIGLTLINNGHESYIAAGRNHQSSRSEVLQIGNSRDQKLHALKTRLIDRHGFGSYRATVSLVKQIRQINPDIIHLHNIHGYYLHIGVLFNFLKQIQVPIVWTLHDCWPFTGHCAHFERINCDKWKSACYSCENKSKYPASWFWDNSQQNYRDKKTLFTGLNNCTIVTPSQWLAAHVKKSFLQNYQVKVIHNGINLSVFQPYNKEEFDVKKKYNLNGEKIVLGVANTWKQRKAYFDFVKLRKVLPDDYQIILVGMNASMLKSLPSGIKGIERTENTHELAALYSMADVFVNPTYVDNLPTTNIEAIACGTPVVTYKTGGSPETIDANTGSVVGKGDIEALNMAVANITARGREYNRKPCIFRAKALFNKDERFIDYLKLYQTII